MELLHPFLLNNFYFCILELHKYTSLCFQMYFILEKEPQEGVMVRYFSQCSVTALALNQLVEGN